VRFLRSVIPSSSIENLSGNTRKCSLERTQKLLGSIALGLTSQDLLPSEGKEHGYVHDLWAIRVIVVFSTFPGSNKLFTTHLQIKASRLVEKLSAFF
jgi:hypothetical protein